MGAWTFVKDRIEEAAAAAGCTSPRPGYVGRREAASPATGLHQRHLAQQARLVEEALTIPEGGTGAGRRGKQRKSPNRKRKPRVPERESR